MKFWSFFFAFAALVNLVVGAGMVFGAARVAAQMGVSGPASGYVVALGGLLIAMFGVGYALAALRPLANRNIIVLGALGKACAALLASLYALTDAIPRNVFLMGLGDLAFALAFTVFLAQTRGKPTDTAGG